MNIRTLAACAVLAASSFAHAQPITDSFVYQGTLNDGGVPANGLYDISFIVYDAPVGGSIVLGGATFVGGVEVVDGLFEAYVDFGTTGTVFDSNESRWLQIRVVPTAGGTPAILSPRQRITPAPLANYALRSGTSLQDAYDNGNTIFRSLSDGAVNITAETGTRARLNLGSSGGTDGAGRFYMYSDAGAVMFDVEPDINAGGGAFLNLARNDLGVAGLFIDGNVNGLESTSMTIFGVDRSMTFSTNVAGDGSVQLPPDAINSTEILNEVGAAEFASSGGFTLTNDPVVIDVVGSVTIDCPSDGYVLLLSSSELQISHINGTESSINVGISTMTTGFQGNTDLETRIPFQAPTGFYDFTVSTHTIVPASAGSNTYYLLGDKNHLGGTVQVLDNQLTAVFIPTSYGTLARDAGQNIPDEFSPINAPMSEIEILREQDESHRANIARQQREIDAMKAQMQVLIEQTQQTLRQQADD